MGVVGAFIPPRPFHSEWSGIGHLARQAWIMVMSSGIVSCPVSKNMHDAEILFHLRRLLLRLLAARPNDPHKTLH